MAGLVEELRDVAVLDYPTSLRQVRDLWLPPASVIRWLERAAEEAGGMSDEAATWLHRVKAAKNLHGFGE